MLPHDSFLSRVRTWSVASDARGEAIYGHLLSKLEDRRLSLAADKPANEAWGRFEKLLAGVCAGSSYLRALAERHPEWLSCLLAASPEKRMADILARAEAAFEAAPSMRDIMEAMRLAKAEASLIIALADIAGVWGLEEVTGALSSVAERLLTLAVRYLLRRAAQSGTWRDADPCEPDRDSGLIVLGMGKFGGHELNYSSDVDLIVFYDFEKARQHNPEPQAFFVRLVRDLVHLLQERTASGYVYRTDLRLRPDPGSTQAAISTDAAFHYYESRGQNWERAAFIKARPVAGDIAAGERFLSDLAPYVWRKYLDYNAILDIHAMKRQIHAAKGHERIAVAGHNLKLGRGGIREIEFFVQSQQLIAGGRQPLLRTRSTLEGLQKLAELEWISAEARDELSESYRFLRRIEHRLQMVADEQTHSLPRESEALTRFAEFAGYENLPNFERDVRGRLGKVQKHYAALFENVPELTPKKVRGNLVFTGNEEDPATVETIRALGFKQPSTVIETLKRWHYGRYRAMRSARSREILTEFTPVLLEAFAATSDADLALATFDGFLSDLPAALQLFSALRANPELLRLIAQIMGSAPRLARLLSKRHRLLDAILDPGVESLAGTRGEMEEAFARAIGEARTYEDKLNRARIVGQEKAFTIGTALLSRQLSPEQAGFAYSDLAEAAVRAVLDIVQGQFGTADLPPPAIIAMGKCGGREMTANSDLDLIFVYDRAAASQHYARFTQRFIGAISAPTSEGVLYTVDTRLRPSGKAGPVAVQSEGFAAYQRDQAWTWEHLALTRARVIAGPADLCQSLRQDIKDVLRMRRDPQKIAADVQDMRALVLKEKPATDLWDTKLARGGLIDVEFIAQYLQLVHAQNHPAILSTNTLKALQNAAEAGVLDRADASLLAEATGLYQTVSHVLRLCVEGRFDPSRASADLARLLSTLCGEPDLARIEARLTELYAQVTAAFERIIAPVAEPRG